MPFPAPSLPVWVGIPALAAWVAALFVAGVSRTAAAERRRATTLAAIAGVSAPFALSFALALSGVLSRSGHGPPPMLLMMAALAMTTIMVAFGPLGARLAGAVPLWALVGAQSFRLPLELVLWRAARDGTMPVQMSLEGRNFDILTGSTALALAIVLYRRDVPRGWVLAWNVLGSLLLANIVGVAMASLPWIAAFGPDRVNEWVLHFPFVWLPAVLVPAALLGHLLVFVRLRALAAREQRPGAAPRASRA